MIHNEEISAYIYRDELDGVTFETFNKFEKELEARRVLKRLLR